MTLTTRRTATRVAAAAGAAAVLSLGLAAPAQAATITAGHYDVVAEIDCAARTLDLHAHQHDGAAEEPLTTATTFAVRAASTVAPTANDRARFAGANPFRVLTQDESLAATRLVVGFEAEYVNCGSARPQVTFVRAGATSVPSGQRAASYDNTDGSQTRVDTSTASGRNAGLVTTGHVDQRWGFTGAGTYDIGLRATATTAGVPLVGTGTLRFAVS